MKKVLAGLITTVLLLSATFVFLISYKDGELIREAVSWLDRRQTFKRQFEEASQGVDYCQWLVGESYAYGYYVKQDHKEAVRWFRYSAEQGNRDGQLLLANSLLAGRGVPKDEIEALMWLNLVASGSAGQYSGEEDQKYRDSVAAKPSPKDVRTAQELALKWRKKSWADLKDF